MLVHLKFQHTNYQDNCQGDDPVFGCHAVGFQVIELDNQSWKMTIRKRENPSVHLKWENVFTTSQDYLWYQMSQSPCSQQKNNSCLCFVRESEFLYISGHRTFKQNLLEHCRCELTTRTHLSTYDFYHKKTRITGTNLGFSELFHNRFQFCLDLVDPDTGCFHIHWQNRLQFLLLLHGLLTWSAQHKNNKQSNHSCMSHGCRKYYLTTDSTSSVLFKGYSE